MQISVLLGVPLAASNLVGVVNRSRPREEHHLEFYPLNTVNNSSAIHFFCVGNALKAWKHSQTLMDPVKFLKIEYVVALVHCTIDGDLLRNFGDQEAQSFRKL